jgi:hypothetical protein
MWVHERGAGAKPPPTPFDVHAIQTWFLDADDNEWIQTVLGPMGRQLAAHWKGAYRVPEHAVVHKAAPPRRSNPLPLAVAGIVLVALIGGVAVAAPGLMPPQPSLPAASTAPNASNANATVNDAPAPAQAAPAATEAPAAAAPQPVATARRATPPPAVPVLSGMTVTFPNGTRVTYSGPTSANRGGFLPATFQVLLGSGAPGSGDFTILLGNPAQPNNLRAVSGPLNAQGLIAVDVPATLPAGTYALQFNYKGSTAQIATITIR